MDFNGIIYVHLYNCSCSNNLKFLKNNNADDLIFDALRNAGIRDI